jgi:hypothetical protein
MLGSPRRAAKTKKNPPRGDRSGFGGHDIDAGNAAHPSVSTLGLQ